jgi:hypothetical protein
MLVGLRHAPRCRRLSARRGSTCSTQHAWGCMSGDAAGTGVSSLIVPLTGIFLRAASWGNGRRPRGSFSLSANRLRGIHCAPLAPLLGSHFVKPVFPKHEPR